MCRSCTACQRYSLAPISFKVSLLGHVTFNRQLRIDLCFFIDRHEKRLSLQQRVDPMMHSQAATFLQGEDSGSLWVAFPMCWAHLYVGDPETILADSGTCLTSPYFSNFFAANHIRLRHTGVESHNSLGEGKKYHDGLRKVFQTLRMEKPTAHKVFLLQLSDFAINTSVNMHGLIPMPLVYACRPGYLE